MGRARSENFPVASRLLPANVRADLMSIYGFARLVDDLGDELAGDRLQALDELEADLRQVYGGTPNHPLLRALVPTVRRHDIPPEPFLGLIEANRQDQRVSRYESYEDLAGYCDLSANPVGHLVLHVFERATPDRTRLSDKICTGLQLVEHWQDVAEDLGRGRVYLPQEDLRTFGVTDEDLGAARPSPAFARLMAFETARAQKLLDEGLPLTRAIPPRAGFAVAAFIAGGKAALRAIEQAGYDVLSARPRPSRGTNVRSLLRTLRSAATRPRTT
jgi:squalene synthase HpnC